MYGVAFLFYSELARPPFQPDVPHGRVCLEKEERLPFRYRFFLYRLGYGAKKNIDAAFGNSRWDTEMLEHAVHAFAINPNPDLEAWACQRGWTVYFPDGTAPK